MKLGLLGDVHANAPALTAVLRAAEQEGVEALLIAGDLVGYYFWPGEVLAALQGWPSVTVRGNHEDMLTQVRRGTLAAERLRRRYGSGIDVALAELSHKELDALDTLPPNLETTIGGVRFFVCHGSPWDNDEYVYPTAGAETLARVAATGADVVLMGHTHYPMVWERDGAILVNAGSVGQARDRRPGAAWAMFDTARGRIEPRVTSYDSSAVVAEARRRHPELPYLASVLTRTE